MKPLLKIAACAVALAAAACSQERGADDLTAEERERLNAAAERLEAEPDVVDASPDSLVATNQGIAAETGEAAPAEGGDEATQNGQ